MSSARRCGVRQLLRAPGRPDGRWVAAASRARAVEITALARRGSGSHTSTSLNYYVSASPDGRTDRRTGTPLTRVPPGVIDTPPAADAGRPVGADKAPRPPPAPLPPRPRPIRDAPGFRGCGRRQRRGKRPSVTAKIDTARCRPEQTHRIHRVIVT